jgi:hypothetical protein
MTGKNVVTAYKKKDKKGTVMARCNSQDEAIHKMSAIQRVLKKLGFTSWELTNDGREHEEAPNDRFR